MSSITAAASSIQIALDLAKVLVDAGDDSVIRDKLFQVNNALRDTQASLLVVQSEQFSLIQRIDDLKKTIADFEAWTAEKERYQLHQIGDNRGFTYMLKKAAQVPEPPHEICAHCYNVLNKKSILQHQYMSYDRAERLYCPNCCNAIYMRGSWRNEHGPLGKPR